MNVSGYLDSYPGMYVIQSLVHSLTAALIVDRAVRIWKIEDPLVRQRFSFMVILLPLFSFPVYQLLNPERSSFYSRFSAIFDSSRWLNMELWGMVSLNLILIILLGITTLIFLFQELLPVLMHTFKSNKYPLETVRPAAGSAVSLALDAMKANAPDIFIIEDKDFILFSKTGRKGGVYLSSGVIDALDIGELQGALAHEIAHIERNKKLFLPVLFLLRAAMFFNPVVLLEFRRIVHEEEKICDDIAVSLTGKPSALARTLKRLYHETGDISPSDFDRLSDLSASVEAHSHNLHLQSRIGRLEQMPAPDVGRAWAELVLTLIVIISINYYVI